MVLPLAVDAQILAGIALLPEADLQQPAAAGVVGGQAGGFHPVQRQLLESELDDRPDGLAPEALAGVSLADPVPAAGGRGDAAAPGRAAPRAPHSVVWGAGGPESGS